MANFRFENLEVWKMATEIGHRLADLGDRLCEEGHDHFGEKLLIGSLTISGILSKGSSSPTKLEFSSFVGESRAAALELANFVIFLAERELITEGEEAEMLNLLKRESKMLENFRQSLERADRPVKVA